MGMSHDILNFDWIALLQLGKTTHTVSLFEFVIFASFNLHLQTAFEQTDTFMPDPELVFTRWKIINFKCAVSFRACRKGMIDD